MGQWLSSYAIYASRAPTPEARRQRHIVKGDGDVRLRFDEIDCLPARGRSEDAHAAALQHTGEREDVAGVVSHPQDGAAD